MINSVKMATLVTTFLLSVLSGVSKGYRDEQAAKERDEREFDIRSPTRPVEAANAESRLTKAMPIMIKTPNNNNEANFLESFPVMDHYIKRGFFVNEEEKYLLCRSYYSTRTLKLERNLGKFRLMLLSSNDENCLVVGYDNGAEYKV